ncbi:SRPBCC domain-containing protein [Neobacillus notoginsengisoli]|uniref:SRPBCC domain-containing protein n=1 Tax=Neobacillus notoginsengisoli TaxID=1578198 RepID=A0A417YZU9_9BACI|nr:SRPBCC domain-containing protein [Neobacillus notoginsengisoli]RHW43423.1 SRPBCC domain-containing protein [Neobacillus notoginsengisoli]
MNIERFTDIKASVSEVWWLISTQEGMRQWFGSDIQIDMRVGGKYRLKNPEQTQVISGEILEIIFPTLMKLSWYEEDSDWVNPTQVTFRLEEKSDSVRVHVTHSGFETIGKRGWKNTYEEYQKGWTRHHLLENLKKRAED